MKMKPITSIAIICLAIFLVTSCELDNYDEPSSSLFGALIDAETGDTVQSDIYSGSRIALVEINELYENPQRRYLVIKPDGSYENTMMFDGLFAVPAIEDGNFQPTDSTSVEISGDTRFDLQVLPYIRILDAQVGLNGENTMEVSATFKLEQTVPDTLNILSINMYAHSEPTVGKFHTLDTKAFFLNKPAVADSTYTVVWDLSRSRKIKDGIPYYYRLSAIMNIPGARTNYAPAVQLTLIDD